MRQDTIVTIRQGDTTTKLAFENGLVPTTIWNHPNNADLKNKRVNANILFPGDRMFIPAIRVKQVAKADAAKHKFVRKAIPEKLRIRFLDFDGEPYAGEEWKLVLGASVKTGSLDNDGWLTCSIPADVTSGKLYVGPDGAIDTCELQFGGINPLTEISGIKHRLLNLGYYEGPVDESQDDLLAASVTSFRTDNGLDPNGGIDADFRDKLKSVYQS